MGIWTDGQQSQSRNHLGGIPSGWASPVRPAWPPSRPRDDYANRVEVERHEHDATLRFYRDGKSAGACAAQITVPIGVLDAIKEAS